MIVTFIPAAGQSRRMGGRDKLLETIGGEPILRRTARIACEALLGPVFVGLRPEDKARRNALSDLDVQRIDVPDAGEGMAATLRAGALASIQAILAHTEDDYEHSGMMTVLPDMPEITANDLTTMDSAFQRSGAACLRAIDSQGRFGHPTVFPLHVLLDFEMLSGDTGAAAMFEAERMKTVRLPGNRARLDLDTPEDWAAWRAETGIKD